MEQTYTGRFSDDGRFIPEGLQVKMPTQLRAIVRFPDEDITPTAADALLHRRQVAAVKSFLRDVAELKIEDNVMTDEDWDEMANIRSKTNAGLSRKIEL